MNGTLFIGWGLGFISGIAVPLVVDEIRRRLTARQARKGLHTLLERLRYRAAHLVLQDCASLEMIDAKLISWSCPIVTNYNGPDKDDELERAISSALNTDPDNEPLDAWVGKHTNPDKYPAGEHLGNPQVAQQIMSTIPLLSQMTQIRLQEVLDLLYRSDYYAQEFNVWLKKSFDQPPADSRRGKVDANIEESIKLFAVKCKNVADAITKVLPDLE